MKNSIDWDELGLLDDHKWVRTKEQREKTKNILSEIDFDKCENEYIQIIIVPIIFNIINLILNESDIKYHDDLLELINIDEIYDTLFKYSNDFLPISSKYLPDMDSEPELLVLYARNYLGGILKKIKNDGK